MQSWGEDDDDDAGDNDDDDGGGGGGDGGGRGNSTTAGLPLSSLGIGVEMLRPWLASLHSALDDM